jgi:hypothetical protein
VRVALGDVTLDGVPDIVTAPGKGSPPGVRVFNGTTGLPLAPPLGDFLAFDSTFTGGVSVASGDVNADGNKDVIAAAGPGALTTPEVRVFSGTTGSVLLQFDPYTATFHGGVNVAAADFDRDADHEIVTGRKSGGTTVRVFDSAGNLFTSAGLPNFVNDFSAYPASFKGGVNVAAGDVNGDGIADIVTGPGPGFRPDVRIFSGVNGVQLGHFLAFPATQTKGVHVALADVDADGRLDIVTTLGSGGGPTVRIFDGITHARKLTFPAFTTPNFKRGVNVGGVRR